MGSATTFTETPDDQIRVAPWLISLMSTKPQDDREDQELTRLQLDAEFYAQKIMADDELEPSVRAQLAGELRSTAQGGNKNSIRRAISQCLQAVNREEGKECNEREMQEFLVQQHHLLEAEAKKPTLLKSVSSFVAQCAGQDKQSAGDKKSEKHTPHENTIEHEIRKNVRSAMTMVLGKNATDDTIRVSKDMVQKVGTAAKLAGQATDHFVHGDFSGLMDDGAIAADASKRFAEGFTYEQGARAILERLSSSDAAKLKFILKNDHFNFSDFEAARKKFDISYQQMSSLDGKGGWDQLSDKDMSKAINAMYVMSKLTDDDIAQIAKDYMPNAKRKVTANDIRRVLNRATGQDIIALDRNGDGFVTVEEIEAKFSELAAAKEAQRQKIAQQWNEKKEQATQAIESTGKAVTGAMNNAKEKLLVMNARLSFGIGVLDRDEVAITEIQKTLKQHGLHLKRSDIDLNHDGKLDDGELLKAAEILNKQKVNKAADIQGSPAAPQVASVKPKSNNLATTQG